MRSSLEVSYYSESTSMYSAPLPSPNGQIIAVPSGPDSVQQTTMFYELSPVGGAPTFLNAVPGRAVGWIDNDHFYTYLMKYNPFPNPGSTYDKTMIYDSHGNLLATPPIPQAIDDIDVISSTVIYAPKLGIAYDWTTGAPTWTSPLTTTLSHATPNRVILSYDHGVYVAPL
ncbi:MAG TPA: hypothetical protein PKA58_33365 [Polyangium sp.]|nr:hypothetical protein [Polyangium sp.]